MTVFFMLKIREILPVKFSIQKCREATFFTRTEHEELSYFKQKALF